MPVGFGFARPAKFVAQDKLQLQLALALELQLQLRLRLQLQLRAHQRRRRQAVAGGRKTIRNSIFVKCLCGFPASAWLGSGLEISESRCDRAHFAHVVSAATATAARRRSLACKAIAAASAGAITTAYYYSTSAPCAASERLSRSLAPIKMAPICLHWRGFVVS